ncbi:MAG: response regulator [Oscillospiraceae bacterium]
MDQNSKKLQSLRVAVLLIAGSCLVIFAILFFSIFYITMPGMLLQSETQYLNQQMAVVGGLFEDDKVRADLMVEDLAVWDETAAFMRGENPDYFEKFWRGTTLLQSYQFDLVVMVAPDGTEIYADYLDKVKTAAKFSPEAFSAHLTPYALDVLAHYVGTSAVTPGEAGVAGITFYGGMPYYVSMAPALDYAEAQTPAGVVILGTLLDNDYFRFTTHYDTVSYSLTPYEDAAGNQYNTSPLYNLSGQSDTVNRVDSNLVYATLKLEDIDGNAAVLQMSAPREVYSSGLSSIARTMFLLMFCVILLAGALYLIVARMVLNPIEKLSRDITALDPAGHLEAEKYSDSVEFVALCTSINHMLDILRQSNISLTAFQGILNSMDTNIYVSDPDTDELLFANEHMRADYGLGDDVTGQVCWQVLQKGQAGRCAFCPVSQLQQAPDAPIHWEMVSTLNGRTYQNTDRLIEWSDGGRMHLQHSMDITDMRKAEEDITLRLRQQELMSAMSQSFISTESKGILINNALRMAGEFLNTSRILLGRYDEGETALYFDYAWHNPEQPMLAPAPKSGYPMAPDDPLLLVLNQVRKGYFSRSNVKEDEHLRALSDNNILSILAVPLVVSGQFWGMLSFSDCLSPRVWSESDIQLVRLISSVISGVLTRSATEETLIRMSSIVNASPQYISYTNEVGDFEYINPGVSKISGYSEAEIFAGGYTLLFGEASLHKLKDVALPRALENGQDEFELELTRKDGEVRNMAFSIFPIRLDNPGIGAIASDVTEQRQLEQALVAAKELAEQSSHAKSDFLSRMSHEMRTPMNAIIGMTHIAKGAPELARKDYCLDKIDEASTHLLGVINDILDVSKIEAGKFELSASEFNFEKMLVRVADVMNFRIDEKKQAFTVRIDANVPQTIIADEQRLAQVITNLLSNAVKFTPDDGHITLTVQNLAEEGQDPCLRVTVQDDGIGISPEQQQRLFQHFEQADGGIARKFGGTGLGLAISKSIVQLMGGDIRLQSALGAGTTITFEVPVKAGTSHDAPQWHPAIPWKDLRLMAVDDAPEVLEYFTEITAALGLHCDIASSGAEAFGLIEAHDDAPYNLIFVDWRMPGMNGIELTRQIKARYGSHTIVIMISAAEWAEIEQEARAAGVDGFLSKPLFSSLIVNCINERLAPAQNLAAPKDAIDDTAGCFAHRRILLAEDIEINREIVQAMLEGTGAQIEMAEDGKQAVQAAHDDPGRWDLILMDIHMPEMDGFEATRRIRALDSEWARRVPIIAMTANVFREDIEKCLAAGMNDHIGKPVAFEEIISKLKKHLPPV